MNQWEKIEIDKKNIEKCKGCCHIEVCQLNKEQIKRCFGPEIETKKEITNPKETLFDFLGLETLYPYLKKRN